MLYSGIDLHKRSVVIHTLDAQGATIAEASLPAQRTAITTYFTNLGMPHRAVVECTGTWYWLRDLLVPHGVDLRLGHAKYLKAISYAKVKTDKVDARMLADLLRVDLIPEAHMISAAQRETRDLLRARLQLVTRAMRCQLTLGGLLAKYNVASPAELPEYPQLQAAFQADQRALLIQQRKQLDRVVRKRLIPTTPVLRLVWVPGIGAVVAATLAFEIDNIKRFASVRQFHSYCRLVPGADNSGGKTRHKRSQDGNRYLKLAFHHAAIRAVQYCPEVRAVHRRWRRRKGKLIARALVAKELATIVYAILSKEERFNGYFKGTKLAQLKPHVWPRRANPPA